MWNFLKFFISSTTKRAQIAQSSSFSQKSWKISRLDENIADSYVIDISMERFSSDMVLGTPFSLVTESIKQPIIKLC